MDTSHLERQVLSDPSTRRLVHQVLELCEGKDIVDAMNDIGIVASILRLRFHGIGEERR